MGIKNFRFLLIALLVSGIFFFLWIVDWATPQSGHSKNKIPASCVKVLQKMELLSFRELVSFLTSREVFEGGISKRELALSSLVAFHDFDVDRALGKSPENRETVFLAKKGQIGLFRNLSEEEYSAILRFAYREKWPFNARGLWLRLKEAKRAEESLIQAFSLTREFYALENLFHGFPAKEKKRFLLSLCLRVDFSLLEELSQEDFASWKEEERRKKFLSDALCRNPVELKALLAENERAFEKGEEKEPFFENPPSIEKELPVKKMQRPLAISPKKAPQKSYRIHVVQKGETLWRISREYAVKLDDIIKLNRLERDLISPGMELKIPSKETP